MMKLLFLFVATLSVFGESKSSPLGQDGRKEDMLIQCLVKVFTKVVSKPDGTSWQPECKDILQKQGSSQTLLAKTNEELLPVEQDEKREFNTRAQEIINELLKAHKEKHEDIDEERSQEEFPNYNKRHHLLTSKEKREDPDNERSQEEFPQKRHSLLSTKEKRWDEDEERSQEDFPTYEQKRHLFLNSNEKRDDPDYDRSQEDFPTYEQKRHIFFTSKEKRDDPDYDRSQEDFPTYEQKRHLFLNSKEKRDDPDYDRSQEDFPTYEQKRHIFFTSKEKREDPDYDRSQEEFPSYVYKRYHDKKRGTEKQIWKPHKYHYNQYDDSSNEDIGRLNFQEKRFKAESAKQYWDPVQQYHHKKQHKHDEPSNEEMESEKRVSWTRGTEEGSKDGEEREKRIWKPNNHIMNLFHKQGKFENENDENLQHLETSTRRSPEEEEEQLIAQELNENKHYYDNQEEQKRHHSDAEEKKQEEKSELRELIKKINEPEEHLLKANEVYDKHNPWINRGYHHPAWYKRNAEVNGDLEELANALRYKLALLSEKQSTEGDKAFPHQRALTPDELKELEKLASAELRAQMN